LCLEVGGGLKLKSTLITEQPVTGAQNVSTVPTEPANGRPLANTLLGGGRFGSTFSARSLVPVFLNSLILPVSLVDPPFTANKHAAIA
jgi:hypothetical protein